MVDIPSNYKDTIKVREREHILRILFDGKERSAYSISMEEEIDITLATVVSHLKKLEKAGFVMSRDATKGDLRRRFYKITKEGKKALIDFYEKIAKQIKKRPDIADVFSEFLRGA